VSFSCVVQHASDNDLFYELVEGDADSCPSDLPVMPMQVSMRDMITVALMASLRCTDVSFELKSLTIEGAASIITTSSRPLLGPILQFRSGNQRRPPGLRICGERQPLVDGSLVDSIVIAGCQLMCDRRDTARLTNAMTGFHFWEMARSRDCPLQVRPRGRLLWTPS